MRTRPALLPLETTLYLGSDRISVAEVTPVEEEENRTKINGQQPPPPAEEGVTTTTNVS